jgi:TPR repeat protein/tRNA A-37 threonylcarbamoyl transferase component Bud32
MTDPEETPAEATSKRGSDDPTVPARARLEPDDPVDRAENWLLVNRIGQGGFGEVWLVRHEWKKERRAVKFCTHPDVRHRLIGHEKTVLLRVMRNAGDHPNIVPLLEYSLKAEIPWLMYEYVEGGTLADAIIGWKTADAGERVARTVRTLHAMCGALGHCHRLLPPIVHRDLKPHNVLMSGDTPRITDFGIGGVGPIAPDQDSSGTHSENSVRLPTLLKTARSRIYSAPERAFGSPPHPRDDVYALGVMAYQLCLGDPTAVPGTDAADTLRELGAPDALVTLVVKSVAMDPNRRPKDASEWESKLAALLAPAVTAPVVPPPTATPKAAPPAVVEAPQPPKPKPQPKPQPPQPSAEEVAEAEYRSGLGFDRLRGSDGDAALARAHFEKAAVLGHAGAQYALGMMSRLGRPAPQDYAAARMWFEKAAAQGHADAQYALGMMCDLGQGLGQDLALARRWFEKAAAQDHIDAQVCLGALYESGRGVPANPAVAREWYEKAAARGSESARKGLARLDKRRK